MSNEHRPVLLQEALEALNIRPDGLYVDGTFGRGGHSTAILERLNDKGRLFCFDKDPQAIACASQGFGGDPRVQIFHVCFSEIYATLKNVGLLEKVDGILLDLGVSSPQLDEAQRGFSFMRDGPLDMRMDPSRGLSAKEWINTAASKDIIDVLYEYGEESFAKKIVHNILAARAIAPITTTLALANIVAKSMPYPKNGNHPATKTFQAIRIYINQELQAVDTVLGDAMQILASRGRLAIISFHSLEDRKVKQFFRHQSRPNIPKGIAILEKDLITPFDWVIKRQRAQPEEIALNPRARSATLRCIQKQSSLLKD